MAKKTREFDSCTIVRTFVRKHYTMTFNSSEAPKFIKEETVTEPCNIPLFSGDNRKAGICSSCSKGWETEGNVFASPEEKSKAVARG